MTSTADDASAVPPPPATGHAAIDAALAAVDLGTDVHEHPAQVAAALEALHLALNPTPRPADDPSQPPRPHPPRR